MWSIFRVLLGLLAAFLIAGVVQASFIITPADLAGLRGEAFTDRLQGLGAFALLAATQSALFAGPAALLAIWIGERRGIRSVFFYVPLGLVLAGGGFLLQHLSEGGATTAADPYVVGAYAAMGVAAGLVYWRIAGRRAGGRQPGSAQPTA